MNMASEVYEMNLEEENTKLKAEIDDYREMVKRLRDFMSISHSNPKEFSIWHESGALLDKHRGK